MHVPSPIFHVPSPIFHIPSPIFHGELKEKKLDLKL